MFRTLQQQTRAKDIKQKLELIVFKTFCSLQTYFIKTTFCTNEII